MIWPDVVMTQFDSTWVWLYSTWCEPNSTLLDWCGLYL